MCDAADRLDARMIVVGNRHVQRALRIHRSIAADVAKRATCDVLIANTAISRPRQRVGRRRVWRLPSAAPLAAHNG